MVGLDLSPELQVVKVGLTFQVELLFFCTKRSFWFLTAAKRGVYDLFDMVKQIYILWQYSKSPRCCLDESLGIRWEKMSSCAVLIRMRNLVLRLQHFEQELCTEKYLFLQAVPGLRLCTGQVSELSVSSCWVSFLQPTCILDQPWTIHWLQPLLSMATGKHNRFFGIKNKVW